MREYSIGTLIDISANLRDDQVEILVNNGQAESPPATRNVTLSNIPAMANGSGVLSDT